MKSMNELPEAIKAKLQHHAQRAVAERANGNEKEAAMELMFGLVAGMSAAPEFWTAIAAIAAGDFDQADEIVA